MGNVRLVPIPNVKTFSAQPLAPEVEIVKVDALLTKAKAGQADAFCDLCRAFESRLLRQALVLCRNLSTAEDLAQDTLVEAWKSLRRYNGRCQFFTWLCAILIHRYHNSLRRQRPLSWSSLSPDEADAFKKQIDNVADPELLPDKQAEAREEAALLLACIETLPARHQEVIYLRFYVDDSLEGIAAAVNCSLGTVKSRLFNALEKLRRMEALRPKAEACSSRGRSTAVRDPANLPIGIL